MPETEKRCLVLASVMGVRDVYVTYPSCEKCHSKLLLDYERNRWCCTRCYHDYTETNMSWRYRLSLQVTDGESACNVCLFGSILDQYFGDKAKVFQRNVEIHERRHGNSEYLLKLALHQVFVGHLFYFGFKLPPDLVKSNKTTLQDVIQYRKRNGNIKLVESSQSDVFTSNIAAFQLIPSTDTKGTTVTEVIQNLIKDGQKDTACKVSKSQSFMSSHSNISSNSLSQKSFTSSASFGQPTICLSCETSSMHSQPSERGIEFRTTREASFLKVISDNEEMEGKLGDSACDSPLRSALEEKLSNISCKHESRDARESFQICLKENQDLSLQYTISEQHKIQNGSSHHNYLSTLTDAETFTSIQWQQFLPDSEDIEAYLDDTGFESEEKFSQECIQDHAVNNPKNQDHVVNNLNKQDHVVNNLNKQDHVVNNPKKQDHVVNNPKKQDHVVNNLNKQDHVVNNLNKQDHVVNNPKKQDHVVNNPKKQDHVVNNLNKQDHVVNNLNKQDHVVNNLNKQDHAVNNPKNQDHVVNNLNKQDHVVNNLNKQDHVVNNPKKQDHVVNNPKKQDHVVNNLNKQDHVVNNPKKQDHVVNNLNKQDHVVNNPKKQDHVVNNLNKQDHVVNNQKKQDHVVNNPKKQNHVVNNPKKKDHSVNNPKKQVRYDKIRLYDNLDSEVLGGHSLQKDAVETMVLNELTFSDHICEGNSRKVHHHALEDMPDNEELMAHIDTSPRNLGMPETHDYVYDEERGSINIKHGHVIHIDEDALTKDTSQRKSEGESSEPTKSSTSVLSEYAGDCKQTCPLQSESLTILKHASSSVKNSVDDKSEKVPVQSDSTIRRSNVEEDLDFIDLKTTVVEKCVDSHIHGEEVFNESFSCLDETFNITSEEFQEKEQNGKNNCTNNTEQASPDEEERDIKDMYDLTCRSKEITGIKESFVIDGSADLFETTNLSQNCSRCIQITAYQENPTSEKEPYNCDEKVKLKSVTKNKCVKFAKRLSHVRTTHLIDLQMKRNCMSSICINHPINIKSCLKDATIFKESEELFSQAHSFIHDLSEQCSPVLSQDLFTPSPIYTCKSVPRNNPHKSLSNSQVKMSTPVSSSLNGSPYLFLSNSQSLLFSEPSVTTQSCLVVEQDLSRRGSVSYKSSPLIFSQSDTPYNPSVRLEDDGGLFLASQDLFSPEISDSHLSSIDALPVKKLFYD